MRLFDWQIALLGCCIWFGFAIGMFIQGNNMEGFIIAGTSHTGILCALIIKYLETGRCRSGCCYRD